MKLFLTFLIFIPFFGIAQTNPADTGELFEVGMWADVYKKKFEDGRIEIYQKKDRHLKRVEYNNLKAERCKKGLPFVISYYPNGRVRKECYEIPSGLNVCLNYADSSEKVITSGSRGSSSELIFENQKLVEIRTKRRKYFPAAPLDDVQYYSSAEKRKDLGDCIEKGEFRNYELYNGFIYYYAENGELEITEKVSNGVNIYNPEIKIQDPIIKKAIGDRHDRNLNGRLETREAKNFTKFNIFLADSLIPEVDWSELTKLKNLETVQVNQLTYPLNRFQNNQELTDAIISRKGFRKGGGELVHDFPDIYASFPGGELALKAYIDSNLVYPQSDTYKRHEGRVYVSFVVDWDGSISQIEVIRGTTEEANREAKRLIREMPNWLPAEIDDRAVRSRIRIPIVFHIP